VQRALVESIHQIGKVMGIRTIAESVEDRPTLDILRQIGVNYAQGYGLSLPRASDLASLQGYQGEIWRRFFAALVWVLEKPERDASIRETSAPLTTPDSAGGPVLRRRRAALLSGPGFSMADFHPGTSGCACLIEPVAGDSSGPRTATCDSPPGLGGGAGLLRSPCRPPAPASSTTTATATPTPSGPHQPRARRRVGELSSTPWEGAQPSQDPGRAPGGGEDGGDHRLRRYRGGTSPSARHAEEALYREKGNGPRSPLASIGDGVIRTDPTGRNRLPETPVAERLHRMDGPRRRSGPHRARGLPGDRRDHPQAPGPIRWARCLSEGRGGRIPRPCRADQPGWEGVLGARTPRRRSTDPLGRGARRRPGVQGTSPQLRGMGGGEMIYLASPRTR